MSINVDALKTAQSKGITIGVVPTDGTQALRLEIDDLIQDEDLANLYFLALEAFQSNTESSKAFSFFEISGIHGQPYRPWDNVTSSNVKFPSGITNWNKSEGYCSHGSAIFPTWHRAYLAQFEVYAKLSVIKSSNFEVASTFSLCR
jgi:tyrosinase